MNNIFRKRNKIINSDLDISSYVATEYTPSFFENSIGKNIELKKENDFLKNIAKKEKQIFTLYCNRFGKNFLKEKPTSLILFENRLKKYLFSPDSKFLDSFPSLQKKIRSEANHFQNVSLDSKINIGSMMYYSLNDKKHKIDILDTNNREKYLTASKNFISVPSKDVVNSEFYKVKFQEIKSRRINRVLSNKIVNKDISFSHKKNGYHVGKTIDVNNYEKNNQNHNNNYIRLKIGDDLKSNYLYDKETIKNDNNNNSNDNNNENDSMIFNRTPSYRSSDKRYNENNDINGEDIFRYYSNKNLLPKSSIKRKIHEYTRKKNKCISFKELNNPKKNILKDSVSPLSTNRTNRNNLSGLRRNNLNIDINIKNSKSNQKIKLLKNLNHNGLIDISMHKNKSRNVTNVNGVTKKSFQYKININNNIKRLDKYTKKCNSLLLNLLKKNHINKKKYSKSTKTKRDKELENILSNKINGKYISSYNKNKIKEEKIKKMRILINDNYLDFDINKLLKEKIEYDKTENNKNNNIIKYNMMSENIFFTNVHNTNRNSNKNNIINKIMTDKEQKKITRNEKMKKIRENFKKNFKTIIKLKNFIKVDKDKILTIIEKTHKNKKSDDEYEF